MPTTHPSGTAPGVGSVIGPVLGLTALVALLLTAFTWPASETAPRDLPVAVAGPAASQAAFAQGVAEQGGDALEITTAPDRAAAVRLIEDREVYAAFVLGRQGTELLTAPAASPTVATLVTQLATTSAASQGAPPPKVTEVAPLPEGDSRGAVFGAGSLPSVLGGIMVGALLTLTVRARQLRWVAALVTAGLIGIVAVTILQTWLGALAGSWWANAGVVALAVAATSLTIIGLSNVIGRVGIAVGALTFMLLGNPLSGMTSAPELLPDGWSTLGQLLPPGAYGSALRGTAFFDGAGATTPLLVLACWAAAGLLLAVLPLRRTAPVQVTEEAAKEPVPA